MRFLLAVLLLPATAAAQLPTLPLFQTGGRTVGLQLGAARPTPTNGFSEVAASGPALNLSALHYVADWIAFGVEMGQTNFGANGRGGGGSAMNLGLLGRVNLIQRTSWSPYIVGGIGYHTTALSVSSEFNQQKVCNPVNHTCGADQGISAKGTSVTGGVGVEKFLFSGLSLSLEYRYRQNRFSATSIESTQILLGSHFWLGKKRTKKKR